MTESWSTLRGREGERNQQMRLRTVASLVRGTSSQVKKSEGGGSDELWQLLLIG